MAGATTDDRWLKSKEYPEKRGICHVCKQKDDLKLAFDQIYWICLNSHACLLRVAKQFGKQ